MSHRILLVSAKHGLLTHEAVEELFLLVYPLMMTRRCVD
jgi:hypothetical protein